MLEDVIHGMHGKFWKKTFSQPAPRHTRHVARGPTLVPDSRAIRPEVTHFLRGSKAAGYLGSSAMQNRYRPHAEGDVDAHEIKGREAG